MSSGQARREEEERRRRAAHAERRMGEPRARSKSGNRAAAWGGRQADSEEDNHECAKREGHNPASDNRL